jgi:4-hydroxy-2-oxoheptanedioate aldolase
MGVFCKTTAPEFIEVIGHAGFDFCILDMEHGPVHLETLQHLIRAAEVSGVLPVVRTRGRSPEDVAQPLDLGAAGVQVPQLGSEAEAAAVVEATKFAPQGHRGVCRFVRAARFSALDRAAYFEQANQSLVILQLEGTRLGEYEKIADVPGVDILFIGPYDLSQALGIPGKIEDPRVLEKMREIIAVAKRKGKTIGVFADTLPQARRWIEAGVQYIAYSVDVGLFYSACRETVAALRAIR